MHQPAEVKKLLCANCGTEMVENPCANCNGTYITFGFEGNERKIKGVGQDAPMDVNQYGGKQSKMDYAFDQLDPLAMFQLAGILQKGSEKYGRDNWKKITTEEHLNHALQHIFAHLAGDKQDDHLGHAFCRLMFAIVVDRDGLSI